MTPTDLLARMLRFGPLGAIAKAVVAEDRLLKTGLSNYISFALGESGFQTGDYQAAHHYYAKVSRGTRLAEARRMSDWTAHKLGRTELGWPRYPVAEFHYRPARPRSSDGKPIHVSNPNQPFQLIDALELTPMPREGGDDANTLVWFNFKDSLGGELFTARALGVLPIGKLGQSPVIATDSRLVSSLTDAFPQANVIAKTSDLTPLKGQVRHYLLARDCLRMALEEPNGLERLSAFSFQLKNRKNIANIARPTYAISWKTTNRRQGRYRNMPLRALASTLAKTDLRFASAQHGVTNEERALLKTVLGDRLDFEAIDTGAGVDSFADALSGMDGIISIDNSLLHIAGSFGLPAVGLLSVPSYWAWPASGRSSRWYDSVKVLHQTTAGDWEPVLQELLEMLTTGRDRNGVETKLRSVRA